MRALHTKSLGFCAAILVVAFLAACTTPETDACRAPSLSSKEMSHCAEGKLQQSMADLNTVYKKLVKKSKPEAQVKLRAVQETWVAYRDRECEYEAMVRPSGTSYGMSITECRARITEWHAKRLQEQLDCEENNSSCVRP